MKTIKSLFGVAAILVASLTLNSCDKDSQPSGYEAMIQGAWVLNMSDDVVVDSDKRFVLEFVNGRQDYSNGYIYDGSREWKISQDYTYKLEGDILTVEGRNADDVETYLKVKITTLNDKSMTYNIITLKYDGDDVTAETEGVDKLLKAGEDLDIIGMWEGVESGIEATRRFEFLDNGEFKYYYKDGDEFVEKTDNDGVYFLYGDFLICNYNNDMDEHTSGRVYECWDLTLDDDVLVWRGTNGGVEGSLTMKRM